MATVAVGAGLAPARPWSSTSTTGPNQSLDDGELLHLGEGLGGLFEGVLPGDEVTPPEPGVVLRHHPERAVEVRELESPAAQDRCVAAVDLAVRVDRRVAGVGVLPHDDVASR